MLCSQMRGLEATVRWGYRTAAALGAWTFNRTDNGGTVTARIVTRDAFLMTQVPLDVRAPMGRAIWRWRITSLQINDTTLTASVVHMEE